jgi:hypothetical protein
MASKVQVMLTDDVDGGDADETVTFSVDGVNYEIDLSEENAASLRADFAEWTGAGRRVGGRHKTTTPSPKRQGPTSAPPTTRTVVPAATSTIRAWAASAGVEVSPRGRVAASVVRAFEAAHA